MKAFFEAATAVPVRSLPHRNWDSCSPPLMIVRQISTMPCSIPERQMRYNCGASMAKRDNVKPDIVAGVPDSGTAHAVGYAIYTDRDLSFSLALADPDAVSMVVRRLTPTK